MRDEELLENSIRDLIMEICTVMYLHGYRAVPMGAMMRLMGVEHSRAQEHDRDFFALDDDFVELAQKMKYLDSKSNPAAVPDRPPGTTLH